MSSNIKLKNANNKTLTLVNPDTVTVDSTINVLENAYTIATVDDFSTVPSGITTVIVKDKDRGGVFNRIDSTTANGGTIFSGTGYSWERQYSGAVNVKWFIANTDASDDIGIQKAIDFIPFGSNGAIEFEPNKTYIINNTITIFNRALKVYGNNANIVLSVTKDYALNIEGSNCSVESLQLSKASGVNGSGIFIKGLEHNLKDISSRDAVWTNFLYLSECNESHFSNIRIDNDVAGKTGTIIYLHGSVNNTFSDCFIGHCNYGVYSDMYLSTEGQQFTNIITVFCNRAFNFDKITNSGIVNCVLDFNNHYGVYATNGQSLYISNCWIALIEGSTGGCIGVNANFKQAFITNNTLVGNGSSPTGGAFASSSQYSIFSGNAYQNLNFGAINDSTTLALNNIVHGSGSNINVGNSIESNFNATNFFFNRNITATNIETTKVNVSCVADTYVSVGITLSSGLYIISQQIYDSSYYGAYAIVLVGQGKDYVVAKASKSGVDIATNGDGVPFFKFPITMTVPLVVTKLSSY